MKVRQPGFTLLEILMVTVLAAITLAAVYETLTVQERTSRMIGAVGEDRTSLRTALGLLESELREAGTIGDSAIGGSDLRVASSDSVVFRAQRKVGFVCSVSPSGQWLLLHSPGEPFQAGDSLLVFVDGDSLRYQDDRWSVGSVSSATPASDAECEAHWPGAPLRKVQIDDLDLTGVRVGAPIRSFEWVTYGLYDFGDRGWGLGRHRENEDAALLVGGLAGPGRGLVFEYFDLRGQPTRDVSAVARMRIGMRTDSASSDAPAANLSTTLFLRNN